MNQKQKPAEKVQFQKRPMENKQSAVTSDQAFCLYGFRSNSIWKKVISVCYLIFCMIMLLSVLTQKRFDGLPKRDKTVNTVQSILLLLFFYSPYIFLSDSALRRHLPLLKQNRYYRDIIAIVLVCVLIFVGYLMVNNLHTPEFFADQENHSYQLLETDPPSCKSIGEHVFECDFCGREYYENIPALGHNHQEKVLEDGTVIWKCTRCDDYLTEAP